MPLEGSFYFKCFLKSCTAESSLAWVMLAVAGKRVHRGTDVTAERWLRLLCVGDMIAQTSDLGRKVKRGKQNIIGTLHSFTCKTGS